MNRALIALADALRHSCSTCLALGWDRLALWFAGRAGAVAGFRQVRNFRRDRRC